VKVTIWSNFTAVNRSVLQMMNKVAAMGQEKKHLRPSLYLHNIISLIGEFYDCCTW